MRGGPGPTLEPRMLVRVQHHPRRADMLEPLLERLAGLEVEVVADPDPDADLRSAWRTYRQCIEPASPEVTHVLTLQDDTVPCDDFAAGLDQVMIDRPSALVSLFLPGALGVVARIATRQASLGERYVSLEQGPWVPTVALVWPVDLMSRFRAVADGWAGPKQVSDDALVGKFRRETLCPAYATVPSLVQHPDTVGSIVTRRPAPSGRNRARTAHQWRGTSWSPIASGWVPSDRIV